MNRAAYLKFHKDSCSKMHDIAERKSADYAGQFDPFSNFVQVESLGICSTEVGFLTRMMDKISRLTNYTKSGKLLVKDESVEDTLLDLANYSILFAGYLKAKKESYND